MYGGSGAPYTPLGPESLAAAGGAAASRTNGGSTAAAPARPSTTAIGAPAPSRFKRPRMRGAARPDGEADAPAAAAAPAGAAAPAAEGAAARADGVAPGGPLQQAAAEPRDAGAAERDGGGAAQEGLAGARGGQGEAGRTALMALGRRAPRARSGPRSRRILARQGLGRSARPAAH